LVTGTFVAAVPSAMITVGKTESPGGARELLDDKNEKIGVVDDLIITPDKSVS
jgi:hypothetical protein